jgi:hypothetical protein
VPRRLRRLPESRWLGLCPQGQCHVPRLCRVRPPRQLLLLGPASERQLAQVLEGLTLRVPHARRSWLRHDGQLLVAARWLEGATALCAGPGWHILILSKLRSDDDLQVNPCRALPVNLWFVGPQGMVRSHAARAGPAGARLVAVPARKRPGIGRRA